MVIAGGALLLLHKKPTTSNPATNQSQTSQNSADTITFDGNTFSPAAITVKSGTTVTIKNTSSQDMAMDSDPHPVHTDDTDLNVGDVAPGQSKTFTVEKKGSFGYHDHLDPTVAGRITIQ
jgi:plastocyanin